VGVRYKAVAKAHLLVVPAAAALLALSVPNAWAQSGTILYSFKGGSDGSNAQSSLVFDTAGNLYGTTTEGGASGDGTVFKLTNTGASWTESVIFSFQPSAGVLGGANGQGTVFELSPGSGGTWTEKVLYSFTGLNDGANPVAGVVFDKSGDLLGTASGAGQDGQGVVFELTPQPSGSWTETVLHTFTGGAADGSAPGRGALLLDQTGNVFGTTVGGGPVNDGVAYELSPNGGRWTETVLHTFAGGSDGADPQGSLVFDAAGNLYGTTVNGGGTANDGTVFKLVHSGPSWTESVFYSFPGGAHGDQPFAGLIDAGGNLYGTTAGGGSANQGVAYKLTLPAASQSVLFNLDSGSFNRLVNDSAGSLYGTTALGGPASAGEVFKVTP
jgi:uncharacterized repeat protein (TIGR03803 family)